MWIQLLTLSALVYLVLIMYVALRPDSRVNRLLLLVLITSFLWPALYLAEVKAEALSTMVAITRIRIAIMPLVPVSLLLLLLHVTGQWRRVPRWGWLSLVPLVLIPAGLSLSNERYRLFRYDFEVVEVSGMYLLGFAQGAWYYVYSLAVYIVVASNLALLIYWFKEGSYWERRQAALLIVASVMPALFDLARLAGVEPVPGFSIAPAMMPISGLLIVLAIVGYRLTDVSPVARAALLDMVPSLVVVLDEAGRIVDVNRRACEALGRSAKELTGILPERLEAPWLDWLRPDWTQGGGEAAVLEWEDAVLGAPRYFKRFVHPLSARERWVGHLIYLDDVTKLREAGLALAERERLREQAGLMKDLHDAVGGISAHVGLLAQSALVEDSEEQRQMTLRGIMGLAREMGVEVRRLISILEQPDFGWNDWMLEVRTFCRSALDGLPIRLHMEIESDSSSRIIRADIGLSVYRLIKECVTNVIKHATAADVWVTAKLVSDELYVEVRDNGVGFSADDQEKGGLLNIQARVRELGGRLETLNAQGVTHRIWIPLEADRSPSGPGGANAVGVSI